MPKTPKRKIKEQLDAIFSKIVRKVGYCFICGDTQVLQHHHIISRSRMSLRWDLGNAMCLCRRCHARVSYMDAILYAEEMKGLIGWEKYEELVEKGREIKKYSMRDLKDLLERFREIDV